MTNFRSTIDVACTERALQARLRGWLDEGALCPERPVALDVRIGDVARAECHQGALPFRQPGVTIWAGCPAVGCATIEWHEHPGQAVLCGSEASAAIRLSPEAADHLDAALSTFLPTVLIFLLRRVGWHHVHAATAVDPAGRGWLLAGNAEAGKSTTAAWLAAQGWAVGSDDTAFLVAAGEGVVARALRTPIALRPGGRALLRTGAGRFQEQRNKHTYWPHELGGSWAPEVVPDVLLFPRVGNGDTRIEPIRAKEMLAELVRWSAWVMLEPALAQEHLDLLASLGRQTRAFRVWLGPDLFSRPGGLAELIP